MQIVENWADIEGELVSIDPHPSLPNFVTGSVRVKKVQNVGSFPNLFIATQGQIIPISIPADLARQRGIALNAQFSGRIRSGGLGKIFADPDHLDIN